jgi:hypothetical protein
MMVYKQRFPILPKCKQFVCINVFWRFRVQGFLKLDSIVWIEEHKIGIS